jgi:uncharacterized protein YjbI with pentapeptide repeats
MMKYEIKHRWTGAVLHSCEANNIKEAIVGAVKKGAFLQGAFLQGADLRGADLQGAFLQGADLQGADLQGAFLQGAFLRGAFLQGADLRGAFLREKIKIKGDNSVLTFIGGGSFGRAVYVFNCDVGIYVEAGCFFGTLDEFREKTLKDTGGDKAHKKAMQYLGFANIAAISFDAPEQFKL